MSEELRKLRFEIRADLELVGARFIDMGKRLEEVATIAEASVDSAQEAARAAQEAAKAAQRAAEAAGRAAEAAGSAAEACRVTSLEMKRANREMADHMRWTEGRLRLMDQRFEAFLGVIEGEQQDLRRDLSTEIKDLKARVERLEQGQPPAA